MRIVTATGIQLQFDTPSGIDYNEAMAESVIRHLNEVLSKHSLVNDVKISLTSDSKVITIDPIIVSKN